MRVAGFQAQRLLQRPPYNGCSVWCYGQSPNANRYTRFQFCIESPPGAAQQVRNRLLRMANPVLSARSTHSIERGLNYDECVPGCKLLLVLQSKLEWFIGYQPLGPPSGGSCLDEEPMACTGSYSRALTGPKVIPFAADGFLPKKAAYTYPDVPWPCLKLGCSHLIGCWWRPTKVARRE